MMKRHYPLELQLLTAQLPRQHQPDLPKCPFSHFYYGRGIMIWNRETVSQCVFQRLLRNGCHNVELAKAPAEWCFMGCFKFLSIFVVNHGPIHGRVWWYVLVLLVLLSSNDSTSGVSSSL